MPIPIFLDVSLGKCRTVDTTTLARAATAPRHLRRAHKQHLMIGIIQTLRRMFNHIWSAPGRVTEKAEGPLFATDISKMRGILPIRLRILAIGVNTMEHTERTHTRRAITSTHHPRTACTRARLTLASGAHMIRTND